jgi:hypothetical protein
MAPAGQPFFLWPVVILTGLVGNPERQSLIDTAGFAGILRRPMPPLKNSRARISDM